MVSTDLLLWLYSNLRLPKLVLSSLSLFTSLYIVVLIDWSRLRKPGISATIGLVGNYKPAKDNSEDAPMTAEWTLSVNDLPYLINADPNRMAAVTGEVECKALSGKPLKANGTVQV